MKLRNEKALNFSDVLLVPQKSQGISSRKDVSLRREFNWKYAGFSTSAIPLINSNTSTTGTSKMVEAFLDEHCLAGYSKYVFERNPSAFICQGNTYPEWDSHTYIHLDFANGYLEKFIDLIKMIRERNPYSCIMAGTVVTPERCEEVINAGADIIKVGLGSGSVCRTRNITGVGYPQLATIMDCAPVVHSLNGHICSDGGIVEIGDACKAFGAGADIVMIGGLIAGTDECQDSTKYYGMASNEARRNFNYDNEYSTSEGASVSVTPKGSVRDVLSQIKGGLRSCLTYTGFDSIEKFTGNGEFVVCSS